jgi:hypothetical protein
MKIRLEVGGLFRAEGRAATKNPVVAFRNFANASKNWNAGYVGICWGKVGHVEVKKGITERAGRERFLRSVDASVATLTVRGSTLKPEDHPFSSVRDDLLSLATAILNICRVSFEVTCNSTNISKQLLNLYPPFKPYPANVENTVSS